MSVRGSEATEQVDYDRFESRPTAADSAVLAELGRKYGDLTGTVRILHQDVDEGRRSFRSVDLDERTSAKARHDVPSLLEELAVERGLGWSEIARLIGVSVGAIRKWRKGEGATPENRWSLARLTAFLDVVEEAELAQEPAGWLLMRLKEAHTVTAADLYVAGHAVELLDHLLGHLSVDQLLDGWSPDWRDTTRSAWKIAEGPDGERVLTRRD